MKLFCSAVSVPSVVKGYLPVATLQWNAEATEVTEKRKFFFSVFSVSLW